MSGGLRRWRRRRFCGVSPVRVSQRTVERHLGDRRREVARDVGGQRLERRDVERMDAAPAALPGQLDQARQEARQRLAAAGRRDQQRRVAGSRPRSASRADGRAAASRGWRTTRRSAPAARRRPPATASGPRSAQARAPPPIATADKIAGPRRPPANHGCARRAERRYNAGQVVGRGRQRSPREVGMTYGRFAGAALAALLALLPVRLEASESLFERGDYLINGIVACGNCHTPQGPDGPLAGMELAGGLVIEEPEFTVVTPNITPDPETGIGRWSDEEIIAAIREGRRPDGSIIGPPMPIGLYRGMSDRDVAGPGPLPASAAAGAQRGAALGVPVPAARELRPAGRRGGRGAARRPGRLRHLPRRPARPLHPVPHAAGRGPDRLRQPARRRRQPVPWALGRLHLGQHHLGPASTVSARGPTPRSSARSRKASAPTARVCCRRWGTPTTPPWSRPTSTRWWRICARFRRRVTDGAPRDAARAGLPAGAPWPS